MSGENIGTPVTGATSGSSAASADYAAARAAYLANAGYEETGSAAQAQAFATACRKLLALMPAMTMGGDGSQVQMSPALIQKELESAQRYAARAGSGRVRYASFEDFRE